MADDTEVKVKIVKDPASDKLTEDLKAGLKAAQVSASQLTNGVLLAQAATSALGGSAAALAGPYGIALESVALLKEALKGAFEMAEKLSQASLEAANNAHKETMALAGTFQLFDAGRHSFAEVRGYAEGVHEELEEIGIKSGIAGAQMTQMYDSIIDRGGVSSEKALELTQNMALVGKVVRGGADSLAQGFSMMEMGVIRARNPLVQLISATKVLQGNAHSVAQQMQHMTPTKQMELAQAAIEKQAELMKKGGVTAQFENLDTLKASFEDIREKMLKSIGQPMLDALIPKLSNLRDYLVAHGDQIEDVMTAVGNKMGEMIDYISEASSGIYDSVVKNWESLSSTFHQVFDEWIDAWRQGESTSVEIHDQFKNLTDDLIKAFKEGMAWVKAAGEVVMDMSDVLKGKAAGTTQADVARKAMQAQVEGGYSASGKGDTAAFQEAARVYRAKAIDAGQSAQAVDAYIAGQRKVFESTEQMVEGYRQAAQHADPSSIDKLSTYAEQNMLNGNEIVRKSTTHFMAELLNNSEDLRKALLDGSLHISSGMTEFIKMLSADSPELGRKLKEMGNTIKKAGGIEGMGKGINFNNNTFHITQDFKDDPDRVMVMFRQDILKSAVSRRQSKLGTIFGL